MKRFIGPLSIIVPYILLAQFVRLDGDIVLAFPWVAAIGAVISMYASSQQAKNKGGPGAPPPGSVPGKKGRRSGKAVSVKSNDALEEIASLFAKLPKPGDQRTNAVFPMSEEHGGGIDPLATLIKSLPAAGGGIGSRDTDKNRLGEISSLLGGN